MKSLRFTQLSGVLGAIALSAACSTWDNMSHTEQGTTVGAASGAVGGAVVGGPVGFVVGGVAGGVVGHEAAKPDASPSRAPETKLDNSSPLVRSAQQALADRGYDVGTIDGQLGPKTEEAIRQFQTKGGLPVTGQLDSRTIEALHIAQSTNSATASARSLNNNTMEANQEAVPAKQR